MRTSPASRQSASRRRPRRRLDGPAGGGSAGARRRARLVERRERGARAEDEALATASSRPGGWRRAGRCTPSRRPRTGPATCCAPSQVGDDAAHHVVRRRGDGDRARVAGSRPDSRSARDDVREPRGVDVAHVEADRRRAGLAQHRVLIARATSSRGASSSTKRSPSASVQRRALAADRLGDEEALAARDAGDRGRVELDELEVGERGAGGVRERACPIPSEPGGFVVRDHSAAAPPVARIVARARTARPSSQHDADAAPVRRPQAARRARPRAPRSSASLDDERGELAHDAAAGRAAAGVDDAAPRVAALEAEREVAVAVGVEAHAEPLEVARRSARRLVDEHLRRAAAHGAAAGASRCPRGAGRASRRPPARRRARPAPSSSRSGPAASRETSATLRALRARRSAPRRARRRRRRRRRRRPRARRSAAHRGVPYPHAAPGSCCAIPPRWSTTPAPIPSAPRGSSRSSGRSTRATGWAGTCATSPAASTRARSHAVHPPELRRRDRGALRGAAAARSTPTRRRRAGSFEAALHGAGGAVAHGRRAAARRGAASARRCTARRATTPSAARAMGFCLFNNVAVAARHALRRARARARARPRLGRPPRQRDERHLPRDRRRALRARSTSRRCIPGTGPASDVGSGAGEGYTVNLPVPAGSGDDVRSPSLVEHVVVPLARALRAASSCSSRPASTRTRDDPLAGCRVTDAGFAAMAASVRRLAAELGVPLGHRARGRLRPGRAGSRRCARRSRPSQPEHPDGRTSRRRSAPRGLAEVALRVIGAAAQPSSRAAIYGSVSGIAGSVSGLVGSVAGRRRRRVVGAVVGGVVACGPVGPVAVPAVGAGLTPAAVRRRAGS